MSLVHHIAIVLALVSGAACKKDASATGEAAQEAMGLYAKGFNALIAEPKGMITEYFENIPADGPDESTKPHLFPRQNFAASNIKEAREAFAAAKTAAPATLADLAPPAADAIAAIDKVHTTFSAAQKYYEAENYKEDKFVRAKELHAQMVEAAKQFNGALNKLEDGLSVIEDQQAVKELAKYGNQDYGYWFRFYNMEAKKFLSAVERGRAAADHAALTAAFELVATANRDLAAFVTAKGTKINSTFASYVSTADSFNTTAVKLVRLLKDAKADADDIDREVQTLITRYNSLVSMANALYQVEAADALN